MTRARDRNAGGVCSAPSGRRVPRLTREGPGLSAFALSDGVVYHTYSSHAPESNFMVLTSQLPERTPKGADDDVPTRRHDEYEAA
jgi:predicted dithiol-disulfide oxidoreductase (DUF899 family)